MNSSIIFLILLPVLTGFALYIWLKVGQSQPILGPFLNFTASILAMGLIWIFDKPKEIRITGDILSSIIIFTVVNAVCTICWIYSLKGYSPQVTAFVEISFPLFLLGCFVLIDKQIGLNIYQIIGAVITLVGVSTLIIGNNK